MPKTHIRVVMYCPFTKGTIVGAGNAAHVEYQSMASLAGGDSVTQLAMFMHVKLGEASRHGEDDPDTVLKIFVAPEWTFRRRTGNYTEAERDQILKQCEAMSKRYTDWLFCLGSIVWGKNEKAGKEVEKTRIFNCAPVCDGLFPTEDGNNKEGSRIYKLEDG
jgi:hypothetical protein